MRRRNLRLFWASTFLMCLIGGSGETVAGTLAGYRLLTLSGGPVKWGPAARGTGSVVTYALSEGPYSIRSARNCDSIGPIDSLLARSGIARSDFLDELAGALQAWSDVANITFVPTTPDKAGMLLGAQLRPTGRAFTNVKNESASAGQIGRIIHATICLNPEQMWKIGFDRDLEVYDLRYTLMHEIGHAIGLDHPGISEALMDFRYNEAFSALQAGDRAGAVALYGPARPGEVFNPPSNRSTDGHREPGPTAGERAFGANAEQ